VLAHEYGHFVNKDTAGGGFSLAVRRSILQMARALAAGGAAAWYNPAWLFVTRFYNLFLRVSQGASRLQEILADRWAALAYGGKTFAAGLTHVVTRSIHFDKHADATLREVIDGGLPLANLYRYAPAKAVDEQEVAAEVAKAMNAEPSPYDSHPRPADRIAWVGDMTSAVGSDLDDGAPAWALFTDREELEHRLTDQVCARLGRERRKQAKRGFLAMEYWGVILNRSFIVVIDSSGLRGWKFRGTVSALSVSFFKPYEWLVDGSGPAPDSADFRKMTKQGETFFIAREDIVSVRVDPTPKWGMGPIQHSGKVYVKTEAGKSREFILLGVQDGEAVRAAILAGSPIETRAP
jgi:hypothetical protein